MKRRADIVGRALCYAVMRCPFCDYVTTENPIMPWCVNCRTEYYTMRDGGIMFDDRRKTPRFVMAKALNASGGLRMGKP